jgi:hypothetical protein
MNRSLSVTRTSSQTIGADGFITSGSESTFVVVGSLQPLSGKERNMLPEGSKDVATHKFYTISELYTSDHLERTDGTKYEVISVEEYQGFGIGMDHYKVILQQVENNGL